MEFKHILVVDDEPGFTRLLKLALENAGHFIVREENDGLKALKTAREFKPDIIFLDVVMPNIDGGDVATMIRADPEFDRTPIIFLTAIVSQKEATKQENAIGGYTFLAKPVTVDALLHCIAEHIGAAPSEAKADKPPSK